MSQHDEHQQADDLKEETVDQATGEGAGEELTHNIEELVRQLEESKTQADELRDQLMRAKAEMDNQRKRAARDVENAHKFGLEKFAKEILGVRDSLELGIEAARDAEADAAKLLEGKELTLKMLSQVMGKFEIEELNPVGEKFDPELHQAMSMQPSAEYPANTVIQVVQKGYTLNGRLIRPAMVIVSQG